MRRFLKISGINLRGFFFEVTFNPYYPSPLGHLLKTIPVSPKKLLLLRIPQLHGQEGH